MAILSWGKPGLYIKRLGTTSTSQESEDDNIDASGTTVQTDKWIKLPDPVEDSTQLETTKGNKTEAKVEGGENEAVRYAKNTYALTFNIRAAAGRKKFVADSDGIIDGEYSLVLVPENPEAPGLKIDRGTLSVEDTWTSADGGIWAYTLDALKPENGDQVKWGKATVSNSKGTFAEDEEGESASSDNQVPQSDEEGDVLTTASSKAKREEV